MMFLLGTPQAIIDKLVRCGDALFMEGVGLYDSAPGRCAQQCSGKVRRYAHRDPDVCML